MLASVKNIVFLCLTYLLGQCPPTIAQPLNCFTLSNVSTETCDHVTVYSVPLECDYTPFTLVFEDNFDGSSLDLSKWRPVHGVPRALNTANYYLLPENLVVENGVLKIITNFDPAYRTYVSDWSTNPWTETTRAFTFTTGEINSYYNYHQGIYEIRCKIPGGDGGFFPAFWAYGQNGCSATEIDIFEYKQNDWNRWRMNAHRDNPTGCPHKECAVCFNGGSATTYRTYATQWDKHNIYWWRDDLGTKRNFPKYKLTNQQAAAVTCTFPGGLALMNTGFPLPRETTDHAVTIIAGMGMENGATYDWSLFPAVYEIDYIRYYRRLPCSGSGIWNSVSDLLSSFGEYNIVTGTAMTFQENAILGSQQQLEIKATESITLMPGFTSAFGSDLRLHIGSSNCGVVEGMVETHNGIEEAQNIKSTITSFGEENLDRIISGDKELRIVPNPASDWITLDNGWQIEEAVIFNAVGMYVGRLSSPELKFNVETLPNGVYYMRIASFGENFAMRFVVDR